MTLIVYVEDDPINARVVRRLLGAHPAEIEVEVLTSGEAALARLPAPLRPDLVLLDLFLPGLNGFELLLHLQVGEALRGVPVVAHSANPDGAISVRDQALAVGCVGYIPKPVPEDFAARVAGYLAGRRERAPSPQRQAAALRAFARATVARLEADKAELRRLLDERTRLAHAVTHELRTPLTTARLAARSLQAGAGGEALAEVLWGDLWAALGELQRRVEDLLAAAGLESGQLRVEPAALDLAGWLAGHVERHTRLCTACDLALALPERPVPVRADAGRLGQVLDNLLTNAHKFVTAGRRPALHVSLAADDGQAVLAVADNGVGVPAAQRERIFAPFTRLPAAEALAAPGLGLGLTIVAGLVAAHGGTVACVAPGPGEGSRFEVRLPLLVDGL